MDAADLTRLLDELQARLDGPARYVFELTIRQVIIEAWVPLALTLLSLVVFALAAGLLVVHTARCPGKECRHDSATCLFVLAGFAVLVAPATGAWFAIAGLPKLLNPEYAALERILRLVVP